jgi:hypothetical protein
MQGRSLSDGVDPAFYALTATGIYQLLMAWQLAQSCMPPEVHSCGEVEGI